MSTFRGSEINNPTEVEETGEEIRSDFQRVLARQQQHDSAAMTTATTGLFPAPALSDCDMLYGRKEEEEILLEAYRRCCSGGGRGGGEARKSPQKRRILTLLTGPSGTGKVSVH